MFSPKVYFWKTIKIFWRARWYQAPVEWYWCKGSHVQLLLAGCAQLLNIPFSVILWNELITFDVLLYWLQCNFPLTVLLIFSTMVVAIFPSSFLAGFIRRHSGLMLKFSLWSFSVLCRLIFWPYIQLSLLFQVFLQYVFLLN